MKTRKLFFALVTVATVMFFNACSDEKACDGVTCSGHGTPTEVLGICTCDCDNGFSGSDCEDEDLCITQNVTCLNGGNCVDGTCDCAAGYEGDSCQTLSRDKFIGTFDVDDVCSASGNASYQTISLASGTDVTKVLISNFWDSFSASVQATINGSTITIPTQEPDSDGFTVTGTGTISGNVITMNFSITDTGTGDTDVCQSTWTKL